MATNILMPALSPTMTEGTLARWLKKEGDPIKAGDVIAEIETDKATMEVEAVDEGVLGKILVDDGTEGVKVNAPIAVLVEDGEAVPPPGSDAHRVESPVAGQGQASGSSARGQEPPAPAAPTPASASAAGSSADEGESPPGRTCGSPASAKGRPWV